MSLFMQLKMYFLKRKLISCITIHNPAGTGRKLKVHKTFSRRPGRLLNILCTFNLRPVSKGKSLWSQDTLKTIKLRTIAPLSLSQPASLVQSQQWKRQNNDTH